MQLGSESVQHSGGCAVNCVCGEGRECAVRSEALQHSGCSKYRVRQSQRVTAVGGGSATTKHKRKDDQSTDISPIGV